MTTIGQPDLAAAPGAAAKLFTDGAAGATLRPAAPSMNNFG
jgi:hypothetical protein